MLPQRLFARKSARRKPWDEPKKDGSQPTNPVPRPAMIDPPHLNYGTICQYLAAKTELDGPLYVLFRYQPKGEARSQLMVVRDIVEVTEGEISRWYITFQWEGQRKAHQWNYRLPNENRLNIARSFGRKAGPLVNEFIPDKHAVAA